jgi:flagellar hook-associated protein 2
MSTTTSPITLSGFNGIDFNSIIDAIIHADSQPLTDLQTQQQNTQNKDNAFVSMASLIGNMESTVGSLADSTAFSSVAATSSDPTTVATTVGTGGIVGSYALNVTQLAKSQTTASINGFANLTDSAADGGSISFTLSGQTTTAINVTSTMSLTDLAVAINRQASGVVASVVNDGTNYKLVVSSRQTGAANGFTINNNLTNSTGAAVTFAAGQNTTTGNSQNAQDAQFTVNGFAITSSSNTVTSAVPGVTLSLVKQGEATVGVTTDYSSLKSSIQTFISQYNSFRSFYDSQQKDVLRGDPVMRESLGDLRTILLTPNSNGGVYKYLTEVGISLTSTGTLHFDESKFDQAISSNPADLQKLVAGDGTNQGVFQSLQNALTNLDGSTGMIKTTRDGVATMLRGYTDRIADMQARLDQERQTLIKVYTAADQAISQLNAQSGAFQNFLSGKTQ